MIRCLLIVLLLLGSCSVRKFYPLAGSVLGGGAGAIAGPPGAALGAALGWSVGELARGDADLNDAKETIIALNDAKETIIAITTGDVDALVERKLKEKKDSGFFDSILDGVYDLLKIGVIIIAIWMIVQLWFSKHIHTKVKKNEKSVQ